MDPHETDFWFSDFISVKYIYLTDGCGMDYHAIF